MDFPNFLWLREARWNQGRESFAQYCLACLFIAETPIGWNKPHSLSPMGKQLLHLLEPGFAAERESEPEFYWEFKLGKFPEDKENGWPDLVVLTDNRVLIMELKTEAGSHRDGQVDWYMRLATARYPVTPIKLIYLTVNPVTADPEQIPLGANYQNVLWTEIAEMIETVWNDSSDSENNNARLFAGYLRELTAETARLPSRKGDARERKRMAPSRRRELLLAQVEDWMARYRDVARQVSQDGRQRALNEAIATVEEAKEIRRALSAAVMLEPEDSPVHDTTLWVWQQTSGGRPLTAHVGADGVELRVSKKSGARNRETSS